MQHKPVVRANVAFFTDKCQQRVCAGVHVCHVVGVSHIPENGMVWEHETVLDAPRREEGTEYAGMGSVLRREAAH